MLASYIKKDINLNLYCFSEKVKNEETYVGISINSIHIEIHQMASPTGDQGSELDNTVQLQELRSQTIERMRNLGFMELNPIEVRPSTLEFDSFERYDDAYRDHQSNAYRYKMLHFTLFIVASFLINMLIFIIAYWLWD